MIQNIWASALSVYVVRRQVRCRGSLEIPNTPTTVAGPRCRKHEPRRSRPGDHRSCILGHWFCALPPKMRAASDTAKLPYARSNGRSFRLATINGPTTTTPSTIVPSNPSPSPTRNGTEPTVARGAALAFNCRGRHFVKPHHMASVVTPYPSLLRVPHLKLFWKPIHSRQSFV